MTRKRLAYIRRAVNLREVVSVFLSFFLTRVYTHDSAANINVSINRTGRPVARFPFRRAVNGVKRLERRSTRTLLSVLK